ncbi:uncharacterized protein VSU04_008748 isoform 2-T2 [Chlamydotis macqueenii]
MKRDLVTAGIIQWGDCGVFLSCMESDSCPPKAKMQRPELCTEGQWGRGEWSAVKRCSASLNMTTGTDIPRCHSGTVTCADEQLEKVLCGLPVELCEPLKCAGAPSKDSHTVRLWNWCGTGTGTLGCL